MLNPSKIVAAIHGPSIASGAFNAWRPEGEVSFRILDSLELIIRTTYYLETQTALGHEPMADTGFSWDKVTTSFTHFDTPALRLKIMNHTAAFHDKVRFLCFLSLCRLRSL